jgi:membrane fusion protein, multidrug efflux system
MNPLKSSLLALSVLAAGCHAGNSTSAIAPTEARIKVDTAVATERAVPQELSLTGVLDASERTELTANATGRVIRVFVELGQSVKAGQPIAQVDARSAALSEREAVANVNTASEQLASAKLDCQRYPGLLAKGAVTKQEYDRAMSQCQTQASSEMAARARAAQASQGVRDSTVRAPFAGKIADRMVHVGDYVRPDTKVVTLLADDPLRLRLTVPEPNISSVKEGVVVRFEAVGLPNRSFQGTIKYVGGEIRSQTRDLVVEAIVGNHDGTLLPGMFVTAHLATGTVKLPVVPKRALVATDTGQSVLVVEGGRLQQHIVQPGAVLGEEVAIADGVKSGQKVVTNPSNATKDGALVE